MATLPETGQVLANGVTYEQYPSLTWQIDKETSRINGTADRLPAVQQAAEVILNVERFRWQIYQAFSGVRLEDLIGQEADFVIAELQRRVKEALSMDDRITGISDFTAAQRGDALTVSFRVLSVYGATDPLTMTLVRKE